MKCFSRWICAALAMAWLSSPVLAADEAGVDVGEKAPAFSLKDDQGKTWNSDDYYGKKYVVVYFYPAAMTGGCTKQACAFRDDAEELKKHNVEVVGLSGDEVAGLALFKKVENLNFKLLSDPMGDVAKKFGVPTTPGKKEITKDVDGKQHVLTRGVTTSRWTFVIDLDGNVAMKNTKVNAPEDSASVLAVVKKLESK